MHVGARLSGYTPLSNGKRHGTVFFYPHLNYYRFEEPAIVLVGDVAMSKATSLTGVYANFDLEQVNHGSCPNANQVVEQSEYYLNILFTSTASNDLTTELPWSGVLRKSTICHSVYRGMINHPSVLLRTRDM